MFRHALTMTAVSRALPAALVALVLLSPAVAEAQATAADAKAPATQTPAERRLVQAIRSSFRVLPIQNGIILVPLVPRQGVDNVELREGTIAVNGTVVTGAELRQRLGREADSVIELSYLDPGAQRRLLLGRAAPGAAVGVEPPVAEPAPEAVPELPAPDVREQAPARDEREFRHVSNGHVRVGGSITVNEDEEVNGPVVAIGGPVYVNGRVRDAVVAVGGDIRLGPKAEVRDDVTAVGGSISRDPAAQVRGQLNEIDFDFPNIRVRPFHNWGVHFDPWWGVGPWRTVRLFGTITRMVIFSVLAVLVLLLVPRGVERVGATVRAEPWKAGLVGFLAQIAFFPLLAIVALFLLISIIGIPLLILLPFAILLFFVALVFGFTGAAESLARRAREHFGWSIPGPFALLLVGLGIIWSLTLLGRVLAIAGGPFVVVGGALLFAGFVVEYAAWTVGLGGTILTRFGRVGRVYPPPVPPIVEPPIGEPSATEPPPPPPDDFRRG